MDTSREWGATDPMTENDYDTDVLVSADWVEDHLNEFQADDPTYRLLEIESPEPPENDFNGPQLRGLPSTNSLGMKTSITTMGRGQNGGT